LKGCAIEAAAVVNWYLIVVVAAATEPASTTHTKTLEDKSQNFL